MVTAGIPGCHASTGGSRALPLKGGVSTREWAAGCSASETTLHQIAPYIGKMKSTMARALVREYSRPGDLVLEPFVGSGCIALECLVAGRGVIARDINPYAVLLTKAKFEPPATLEEALSRADHYLRKSETHREPAVIDIPDWVREFFHPQTLAELANLNLLLSLKREHFLQGCLLGILHHQRPGFLSYPASHLVPYLRTRKFPRSEYPAAYEYRAVEPRLQAKIRRVYRRFPTIDRNLHRECRLGDSSKLRLRAGSIGAVITSPPYMNALDYARDNRLRLWFLGVTQHRELDRRSDSRLGFIDLMERCLSTIRVALKQHGKCVLVLGEVSQASKVTDVARVVTDIAVKEVGGFSCDDIFEDCIPDIRRARREGQGTKREWIVVLSKTAQ